MNAIKLYRAAHYCHTKKIPLIPKLLKSIIFLVYNSVIPYTTHIGKDTKLAYGGIGVVVHAQAKIGSRVIIGQGVTVGRKLRPSGIPTIGDDVYISAGSRILGDVTIGNNVIIGANSVVTTSIPSNCIAAGAPARVIRQIDQSIYDLLENIF